MNNAVANRSAHATVESVTARLGPNAAGHRIDRALTAAAEASIDPPLSRTRLEAIPMSSGLVVVTTYTVGMALFTIIMGNAFAAFPVMTAGIGLPFIVHQMHGNPIAMSAIGMLSGFCGTLMTPMAANFNIVPAALLDLPDRNGVIRVQIPTALVLLACNTVLMYVVVFRS